MQKEPIDRFYTRRTLISTVRRQDAFALWAYYNRNSDHLQPFEPRRSQGYHTQRGWRRRTRDMAAASESRQAWHLVARLREQDDIIAICNFNNVIGGIFQACYLGYSIDAEHQGQGLMQEVVGAATEMAFGRLNLHRIMANYMPENERSGRLLARLGFEQEGVARSYLCINGVWRDHILTSKLNPEHMGGSKP